MEECAKGECQNLDDAKDTRSLLQRYCAALHYTKTVAPVIETTPGSPANGADTTPTVPPNEDATTVTVYSEVVTTVLAYQGNAASGGESYKEVVIILWVLSAMSVALLG
ncbi:hypothetical protein BKA62DRAFT_774027 [Auriculariales sp. MPI-PUGE-AT-0066]|nr:hypothetical protein BKA62DRAFT_774027 [Auriculariales sp. MPI-PUGE-AT-0066]